MRITIVIPLYNEAKHIENVLYGVFKHSLPVVVVDDGSKDNSQLTVNNLQLKHKNLKLLTHIVNLGKGAAMKTGAEYAFEHGAEAVIFMDSDGQHSADDLPKFIKALSAGRNDFVFGSRNLNFGVPLVRYLGNKFASVICASIFGIYISDALCGYRGLTKKAYNKAKWESDGYGVEIEMIARVAKQKLSFVELPVETVYLDSVKGVTPLHAIGILGSIIKWWITI